MWRFEVDGFHSDHMALPPDGARMVVSDTTAQRAHVLDTAPAPQVGSFTTGAYPHGNDYSADGQRIYNSSIGVTTFPKSLEFLKGPRRFTVADANTLRVIRTYEFAHGIRPAVFLPDETLMYAQLSYLNGFIEYDLSAAGSCGPSSCRSATPAGPAARTTTRRTRRTTAWRCPATAPAVRRRHDRQLRRDRVPPGADRRPARPLRQPAVLGDDSARRQSLPGHQQLDDTFSVISYRTAHRGRSDPGGDFPQRERLAVVTSAVLAALG